MMPNTESIPPALSSILLQLEDCQSHDEYLEILEQLDEICRDNPHLSAGYFHLLSKYPNLSNIDPKTITKSFHEFYALTSPSTKLALDLDSTLNIKKEFYKTFHDNNVDYLASSTLKYMVESEIGLDDLLYSDAEVREELSLGQPLDSHMLALPDAQVALIISP
eukprot:TRINITY_DN16147_c0_g2_i3.p1 TRINITY_DN16147_c0_g2~~TRINITY_DN16147_c0_g2_i3.p1  ORF type:complete len:164 (-),score=24.68 TRINITY_DN16147_c0_g2_i3:992-1483(-)